MEEQSFYYRRNLPHYQPANATFFVTFRLAGSLPPDVIAKLKEEYGFLQSKLSDIRNDDRKKKLLADEHRRYFHKFDEFLDKHSTAPTWLSDPRIAHVVAEAIRYRDGNDYDMIAYCIMPNHVHLVFEIVERFDESLSVRDNVPHYKVTDIMGSLKKHTALEANKILCRSGQFWQHESYDHVVRSGKELDGIISYVLNNPVKAKLVSRWEEWKWSYCIFEP
jgi:putative transposase